MEYKNIIPLLLLKQQQHKGTSGIYEYHFPIVTVTITTEGY